MRDITPYTFTTFNPTFFAAAICLRSEDTKTSASHSKAQPTNMYCIRGAECICLKNVNCFPDHGRGNYKPDEMIELYDEPVAGEGREWLKIDYGGLVGWIYREAR